jgi:hypothetical protein
MLFGKNKTPLNESHWIFWSPIDENAPQKNITFINYNTYNLTTHTTLLDYPKMGEKHNNFKAMKKNHF